ncbi:hypothetical protein JRQ81_016059 [Phrynocephalus forsythii]|uniref:Uncharacterized protein n=1 Tax=Phrynocephalus forsythii TaxID=171643 RepID=A0A9Q1B2B2_9SAUR|nr:hypothetical protein JRQ81_016059 [Phrynocephalus forsythii]
MGILVPHCTENQPTGIPICILQASILNIQQNISYIAKPLDTTTSAVNHKTETPNFQAFLRIQYPPRMIKEQINKARHITRNNLLQDRSKGPDDRTPLVVTYSPQVRLLIYILNDLQPILDKCTSLSKALGSRPILA